MKPEEKKLMGARIKECRKKNGLSQDELAVKLGMKRTNIANYESGRVVPPGYVLLDLADIFGVTTDFILGLSDNPYHGEQLDDDLRQIQRAKRRLPNEKERERMDRMIEMIKLSFVDAFNDGDGDDDDNDI